MSVAQNMVDHETTFIACYVGFHVGFSPIQILWSLMPKCADQNRLATLHLAYVKCPIHSNHTHAKKFLKIREFPDFKLNGRCEHKDHFNINIKKRSHFPKWTTLMFMQTLHCIDWSQHSHMSSHLNKNMTTLTIFTHSNHEYMAKDISMLVWCL